jgi:hypothetical protein
MSTAFFTDLTSGSEVRNIELSPIMDSFVSVSSPQSNYGKELYLRAEYQDQKTVIQATSFTVPPGSRFFNTSLPKNGKITGSFEVTGGGNKDINFVITNGDPTSPPFPHPTYYYREDRVTTLDFSFVAPYTGDFYLGFDNSFSFVTSKEISLSSVVLTMEPFGAICSPMFLLFDLSIIPPEATINMANLSLSFKAAGVNTYDIVKTFYCSKTDWSEQLITYENAPLTESYLVESSSFNMSAGIFAGTRREVDIKSDVVRSLVSGRLTEVVAIVGGELPGGMVEFYSRESENEPKLEVTYTYASTICLLSSAFLIEGQNVAANVTTDPSQTSGKVKIQYSTDQIKWVDIGEFSGGTTYYVWAPPPGQIYVRGVWEISLSGGSYIALSSVHTIYVIPIYLLVVIPVAIVGVICGVYFWRRRRRRQRNPPKPPQPAA